MNVGAVLSAIVGVVLLGVAASNAPKDESWNQSLLQAFESLSPSERQRLFVQIVDMLIGDPAQEAPSENKGTVSFVSRIREDLVHSHVILQQLQQIARLTTLRDQVQATLDRIG